MLVAPNCGRGVAEDERRAQLMPDCVGRRVHGQAALTARRTVARLYQHGRATHEHRAGKGCPTMWLGLPQFALRIYPPDNIAARGATAGVEEVIDGYTHIGADIGSAVLVGTA